MPDDVLDVSRMNVNPTGKHRVMRHGWWGGKPQKMNYALRIPKGIRAVLEERGSTPVEWLLTTCAGMLENSLTSKTKSPQFPG